MSDPIEELKRTTCACDIDCLIAKDAILALDSRLTALERTVADYNDAVDAITAWADGKDRQAYEQAIKEIPDKADRAEIVERYAQEVWHRTAVKPEEMGKVRRILNDLLDEVTQSIYAGA